MTEPQTWTVIGIVATTFFGMLALIHTSLTRVIRAEIGGLRGEMNARFESVTIKIDHLDRGVQSLMAREATRD